MSDIYQDFWEVFLETGKAPENAYYTRCCYFGRSDDESVDEVHRLMRGEKTAVSHCVPYYIKTRATLPKVGEYTLVTDYIGNPGCVLLTKEVTIAQIQDIPAELAAAELPGKTLEEWRAWRREENRDLAKRFGFPYSDDLAVLVETVELLYPTIWLGRQES